MSKENLKRIHKLALSLSNELYFDLDKIEQFLLDLFSYIKLKHNDYSVEIPSVVFKNCQYGSGHRYLFFKQKLLEKNVLIIGEKYSTTSHKCTKYKVLKEYIEEKSA